MSTLNFQYVLHAFGTISVLLVPLAYLFIFDMQGLEGMFMILTKIVFVLGSLGLLWSLFYKLNWYPFLSVSEFWDKIDNDIEINFSLNFIFSIFNFMLQLTSIFAFMILFLYTIADGISNDMFPPLFKEGEYFTVCLLGTMIFKIFGYSFVRLKD